MFDLGLLQRKAESVVVGISHQGDRASRYFNRQLVDSKRPWCDGLIVAVGRNVQVALDNTIYEVTE